MSGSQVYFSGFFLGFAARGEVHVLRLRNLERDIDVPLDPDQFGRLRAFRWTRHMWLTLLTKETKIQATSLTPKECVKAPNGQKFWSYEMSPFVEREVFLIERIGATKGPHGARGTLRRQRRRL